MKAVILACAAIFSAGSAQSQSFNRPPLDAQARRTYTQAHRVAEKELKLSGMAGLRSSTSACWDKARSSRKLSSLRYCFYLHDAAASLDEAFYLMMGQRQSERDPATVTSMKAFVAGRDALMSIGLTRDQAIQTVADWSTAAGTPIR